MCYIFQYYQYLCGMYLYNVSIIVEDSANDLVLNWLQQNFIPSLDNPVHFLQMVDSPHEGTTYCLQINVDDRDYIEKFKTEHLQRLQQYLGENHLEKAFIFDSIMKYLPN